MGPNTWSCERVGPSLSVGRLQITHFPFCRHFTVCSRMFSFSPVLYTVTLTFSSHSQGFAPHFTLSHTASFCLAPAVPLLNRRQVRSTYLATSPSRSAAGILSLWACSCSIWSAPSLSHSRTGDSPAHQSAQLFDRAARGQPVRGNKS